MSNLLQTPGSDKVKYILKVDIHYTRIKLAENCLIAMQILRGKTISKETQIMNYNTTDNYVKFDYPASFNVTMQRKGKKYVKKFFSVKLFIVNGDQKSETGRVKIDFSQIPLLKKSISKRELPLQHCVDPLAIVCVSVSLNPVEENGNIYSLSSLKKNQGVNSTEIKSKTKNKLEPEGNTEKNEEDDDLNELHKENPEEAESDTDSISSKMSFSDLIVNPKDSELDSESSSSEEEYKELSPDKLIAHYMPKTSRDYVKPNENSKALQIAQIEEKSGFPTKRDATICASCAAF
jgi:N-terminal C2 in EEIG1 and EHBP1 proteins